jgi:putative phosphoribosyl transferase
VDQASLLMFKNRIDAGLQIATKLKGVKVDVVVGLVRGGVVIAQQISIQLQIPLYALIVKKIPSENEPELGLGAITLDGINFINRKIRQVTHTPRAYLDNQIKVLTQEISQILTKYSEAQPNIIWENSSVILTDDGVATGSSIRVAIEWLRLKGVKRIIIAMPVAPNEFVKEMKPLADEIIVIEFLGDNRAVGNCYTDFSAVKHEKVIELLKAGFLRLGVRE